MLSVLVYALIGVIIGAGYSAYKVKHDRSWDSCGTIIAVVVAAFYWPLVLAIVVGGKVLLMFHNKLEAYFNSKYSRHKMEI